MYVPDHFREDRADVLHQAVRQIGFATLVTQGLQANHLPMLLEGGVLRAHVTALSDMHGAPRDEPWKVSDAPSSYVDGLLRAIMGFELSITSLDGKWKLSQNREAAGRAAVQGGFQQGGHEELSRLMAQADD